eukprot:scaffold26577_cov53-Phaeocystis_antarctica.AAC.3
MAKCMRGDTPQPRPPYPSTLCSVARSSCRRLSLGVDPWRLRPWSAASRSQPAKVHVVAAVRERSSPKLSIEDASIENATEPCCDAQSQTWTA